MKLFGIEFAPLRVPLERRLQTLAAAGWLIGGGFGPLIGAFLTLLIIVFGSYYLRLLLAVYFLFMAYDWNTRMTGGRSKRFTLWFRNLSWWRYYCNYFPIKLIKTVDLDPTRNYLFCAFPHGLLGSGVTGAFATNGLDAAKLFPGLDLRIITLDQHFKIPIAREYALCFGACSCDEKSLNYLLSTKPTERDGPTEEPVTGRATVILVGGAAEAYMCKPNNYRLVLNRRKGFVRIALKNGTPLVPVFSFGEVDLYDQVDNPKGSWLRTVQNSIKKVTGVAPVVPVGRGFFQYSFGLVPRRKPIHIVVGAPMEVPKIAEPTREQVNKYHAQFTEKLIELFETHKYKYVENPEKTFLTMEDNY